MTSLRLDQASHNSSTAPSQSGESLPLAPTNDDIEAVIKLATSARPTPDGRPLPTRDTRTQLYVGNLPYRVRWQDLKDLFRKSGTVLRADVSLGPDNRSRGYGTVLLATAEDAGRAMDMFNGYTWQTRTLEVRLDRLPPDFDAMGISGAPAGMSVSAPGGANTPLSSGFIGQPSLQAISYASSQLQSGMPNSSSTMSLGPSDDGFDYTGLLGRELSRSSSNTCKNLFVGNLPFHCQWQDLKDLFRQAGTILRADVSLGPDGRSRGFGTVTFANDADTERAVHMFNGYDYSGRTLKVHYDKFAQMPLPPAFPMSMSPPPSAFGTRQISLSMLASGVHPEYWRPSSPIPIIPSQTTTHPYAHRSSQEFASSIGANRSTASSGNASSLTNPSSPISPKSKTNSASPRSASHFVNNHPAHPGPISLPPPPPAGTFPISPHSLSPNGMSPLHHPASSMYPPHHAHVVAMTPHGLPPITPSMPSFTFLPQPSPLSGPSSSMNSQPVHPAHHVFGPFSPGMTMSPGAFWGRPGPGAPHAGNPFLNPAVGSPVLMHQPLGPPHSPGGFFTLVTPPAGAREEPSGYFPPVAPASTRPDAGYFPPVAAPAPAAPLSASALSQEILRDRYDDTAQDHSTSGSGPSDAGTDFGLRDGEGRAPSSRATSWGTGDGNFDEITRKLAAVQLGAARFPDVTDAAESHPPSRVHSLSAGSTRPPPVPPILAHKTRSDQTGAQCRAKSETPSIDSPTLLAQAASADTAGQAGDLGGGLHLLADASPAARRASWAPDVVAQNRAASGAVLAKGLGLKDRS